MAAKWLIELIFFVEAFADICFEPPVVPKRLAIKVIKIK